MPLINGSARPGPSPAQARGRARAGPGPRGPGLGLGRAGGRFVFFIDLGYIWIYLLDIFWYILDIFFDIFWYIFDIFFVTLRNFVCLFLLRTWLIPNSNYIMRI